jgi:hypothetical protein
VDDEQVNDGDVEQVDTTASGREAYAVKMAGVVFNAEVSATMEESEEASDVVKRTPLRLMMEIRAALAVEDMTLEDLPTIGDENPESNNPEVWKTKAKKTDGTEKTIKHRFYAIMYDASEHGRDVAAKRVAIEAINDKHRQESLLNSLDAKRNNGIQFLRKSVQLYQTIKKVTEMAELQCTFLTDKDPDTGLRVPSTTTRPMIVNEKGQPGNFEDMSIGQFLSVDWTAVEAKGGDYSAFKAQFKKKRAPKAPKGSEQARITGPVAVEAALAALNNYLDDDGAMLKMQEAIGKKGNDSLLIQIGTAYENIYVLYGHAEKGYLALKSGGKQTETA